VCPDRETCKPDRRDARVYTGIHIYIYIHTYTHIYISINTYIYIGRTRRALRQHLRTAGLTRTTQHCFCVRGRLALAGCCLGHCGIIGPEFRFYFRGLVTCRLLSARASVLLLWFDVHVHITPKHLYRFKGTPGRLPKPLSEQFHVRVCSCTRCILTVCELIYIYIYTYIYTDIRCI